MEGERGEGGRWRERWRDERRARGRDGDGERALLLIHDQLIHSRLMAIRGPCTWVETCIQS